MKWMRFLQNTDHPVNLYGESINVPASWRLPGEPGLYDTIDPNHTEEHVVELYFNTTENRWVLNNVANNLPDYMSSNEKALGYICEYEN